MSNVLRVVHRPTAPTSSTVTLFWGHRGQEGLISREKILKLSFSCVYPQTQTLSMNVNSTQWKDVRFQYNSDSSCTVLLKDEEF